MITKDSAGYPVSGASPESLAAYEKAAAELRCFRGDPVSSVQAAIEASPTMPMAHALHAWLHLLGTEPAGLPVAHASLAAAKSLPADDRERGHLRAIELLIDGHWREAARALEDVTAAWPLDTLALQAGHQIDFFTGDSRMLRDRVARALPAWSASVPGYHAVLGMYAFGLEECGDYARAEETGRRCVELERRDGWGWHAVTHVMEMQNRSGDGIGWLRADTDAWSKESFFSVHNWWHLALFYLERGDVDEVLRLCDGPIFGARSQVVLDMIDVSALLWRLTLRGVDVGGRWDAIADIWAPVAAAGNYAFNEFHAMMAFVGSGREHEQQAVVGSLEAAAAGSADPAAFAREVGLDATLAIQAFGRGRYADTVRLLRPLRSYAHRFGGSHAQRDLIDLTLIEAANRSRQKELADALAAERRARRGAGQPAGRSAQVVFAARLNPQFALQD
ncbi:MAG TPA: tetratricopeptide repeat protein [Ramlibacter sp.]|nr:tetratricopeptide repeat protein [Ramlibacter sp.]